MIHVCRNSWQELGAALTICIAQSLGGKKDKWFCIHLHLRPYNVSDGELPCWVIIRDSQRDGSSSGIPRSGKGAAAGLIPRWVWFWCAGGYFVDMGGLYFAYKPQTVFIFFIFWVRGWAIKKTGAGLTRKWYLKSRRRLWQDHHISLSHVPLLHINNYLLPPTLPSYHLYLSQSKNFTIGLYIDNILY